MGVTMWRFRGSRVRRRCSIGSGTPAKDKKLVVVEAGHAMVGYAVTARESLEWLDRYLGSVPMPSAERRL